MGIVRTPQKIAWDTTSSAWLQTRLKGQIGKKKKKGRLESEPVGVVFITGWDNINLFKANMDSHKNIELLEAPGGQEAPAGHIPVRLSLETFEIFVTKYLMLKISTRQYKKPQSHF